MKKRNVFILLTGIFFYCNVSAQFIDPAGIQASDTSYENIKVQKLYSDSLSSSFMIWVKKEVKSHKHNYHTEVITVLDGSAEFYLGEQMKEVKKGDIIIIPKGTVHSVTTTSIVPLKVLSVQSPIFDGSDREMVH